ncbi:MAG: NYN domain-containing protein [Christensenellaceae bacterium]|jgi:hypothetical protein|nr:NYN domain-containing protein [Christensenellaceae bacterium]
MNKPKIVILADISSLKVTCVGFQEIVTGIAENFDVVACKFYSYVAKRNRDFNEYIAANGFDTSLPSESKKRNKLDSRQIIDAIDVISSGKIDAIGLIVGDGDILPLLNLLKSKGVDVYNINVAESKYTDVYSGFISVPLTALRKGYTAPAMRPQSEKPKRQPPQRVAPAVAAPEQIIIKEKEIVREEIIREVPVQVAPTPAPVTEEAKENSRLADVKNILARYRK